MKKIIIITIVLNFTLASNISSQNTITATIPYQGKYDTGEYKIFQSAFRDTVTLPNIRKPIILVEGFDPEDRYTVDSTYRVVNSRPPFPSFSNRLHNAGGFDIVVLNFKNGGTYIQSNAFVLVELINQINKHKPHSEPLVVIGFSMGGLVARYALTYMEEHGMDHETRLYVSFDSPHKGAHIPVGIQALVATFNLDAYVNLFPGLGDVLEMYKSPAAKQMLKYRISSPPVDAGGELPINYRHLSFVHELQNLNKCNGFPKRTRNIAVSLGSWNGVGQRSNGDLNGDGIIDLQHAGFPTVRVNISRSARPNNYPQTIWELNICELAGWSTFQASLGTTYSTTYPYFSQRSSYGDLGNFIDWPYLYYNSGSSPISSIYPSSISPRYWWYKNQEPLDFAPGGFNPLYRRLVDVLNSNTETRCAFNYVDNGTFIPTVSALAFDTDDLFYNIQADANRLEKTPFDNIIGITGDNTSHIRGQTSNPTIVNWLLNEINNDLGSTCAQDEKSLTGTVNQHEKVNILSTDQIKASNYTIKDQAEVNLQAGSSIELLPGFETESGATFLAEVSPCVSKPCFWKPASRSRSKVALPDPVIDTVYLIPSTPQSPHPRERVLTIYPNPNRGTFTISSTINGHLMIASPYGLSVYEGEIKLGNNELSLELNNGVYQVIVIDEEGNQYQETMIKD